MKSLTKRNLALAELRAAVSALAFLSRTPSGFAYRRILKRFSKQARAKAEQQIAVETAALGDSQIFQEPRDVNPRLLSFTGRLAFFEVTGEIMRHGVSGDIIVLQTSRFRLHLTCEDCIHPNPFRNRITDFTYEIID